MSGHFVRGDLPRLTTVDDRLARLIDWDYCGSVAHQDKRWWFSWREWAPDHPTRMFVNRFINLCMDRGIPVHATAVGDDWCRIRHSQWGDQLDADEWVVIASFGHSAAHGVRAAGGRGDWTWNSRDPSLWRYVGGRGG